jgi:poly-gamma-glutamate capsule biosynthesis protein CapA/YwtB (metallophosphatase superfamily)
MNRTASLISILLTLVASSSSILGLRSLPKPQAEPKPFWLYLRDGQDLAPSEKLVELIAVGDLMLGRDMASRSQVFSQVSTELRSADLTLGNFEGAIPVSGLALADLSGDPAYEPYRLLIPTNAIEELRGASFDILSLANNHALDAGEAGFNNTRLVLESAGITALGAGIGAEVTSQFDIRQIRDLTIAFLAFNRVSLPDTPTGNQSLGYRESQAPPVNLQNQDTVETIKSLIRLVRKEADFVVVSIHWGKEYQLQPDPAQKELAETMLKAGADIVLGHHPHLIRDGKRLGKV